MVTTSHSGPSIERVIASWVGVKPMPPMGFLVRVDVFVRNIEHFDAIHRVRREYFTAVAPASTTTSTIRFCRASTVAMISFTFAFARAGSS